MYKISYLFYFFVKKKIISLFLIIKYTWNVYIEFARIFSCIYTYRYR